MRVAQAKIQAQLADAGRSRVRIAAAAGVVAITAVAFMPPFGLKLSALFDGAGIAMRKPASVLAFISPSKLRQHFETIGYNLDEVRKAGSAVPRVFLARVPDGLADVKQTSHRKEVFLSVILPLVLEANENVLKNRAQLLVIDAKQAAGYPLSAEQQARLESIAAEYSMDPERIDLLLRRVDAVPPSLALAQAAIESGWGTSRFVREGNAIFGQWTWGDEKGIVPSGREEGKSHKIKSFEQIMDSVRAYVHNLNTHRAYQDFREKRQHLRAEGKRLSGLSLVPTLSAYSELKGKYLGLLRSIITVNELQPLDAARLKGAPARRETDA